jgi:UTP--glucose-1-phosphate uridylyltransferase
MLPATKAIPKEMLPIVDVPIIQLVVEEAVESGIEQIVIVTSGSKRAIEDHFDYAHELEQSLERAGKRADLERIRKIAELAKFVYVRQGAPLGNGHAVLCAREVIGEEPFVVLWGDDIARARPPVCRQMIDVFERFGGPVICAMAVPPELTSRYGVIDGEQVAEGVLKVAGIVEKPAPGTLSSNLVAVKEYVLPSEIFEILANTRSGQGGEIWLTDALNELCKRQSVYAAELRGRRYDPGNKLGYLQAVVEYALADEELGPEFRAYLEALSL